jgi:hypothetical protein
MRRRSRRRNRRKNRRSRRGGGNYGSKSAKQTMTAKGRSTIGRFGSTRKHSARRSRLTRPPPKGKSPRPGNRGGPDPIVWKQNPLFKGKTKKQFVEEQKKMTKKLKGNAVVKAGKQAGQKRAHATWREAAALGAERELEKHYGNNRPQTQLGNVQAKGNAAWGAANATSAFRRSAWDARKNLASLDDLKPISMGSKIASNVNTAKQIAKKTGVSISQVKAGKQAANIAANIVANAAPKSTKRTSFMCPKDVDSALKKLGICQQLGWGETCPRRCSVAAAGGSRRHYAKKKARPGPYRRRRSRRRKQRGGQPDRDFTAEEKWVHGLRGGRRRRTRRR